ncbi:tRNA (adenosine(37)-N6)-dimethylallyltransferase MiaA [Allomuricauda sp. SCSIO 65647]|uniref:tRNA (adenosine(37)-N6)-dimethylallyltransferase MiaA n=1 Tax=Allomuricauda sp. SCSIO 65647 TaxID=2908843 RepID=UPI001F02C608|nr:tRNA (adenosine(37)-N6)-dimethylallyltransferase MiaA [Muricauda sp. SCSIO 65647]UJH67592.1 tRNA (adenosine(37)-N6)-dimethylallyltransferase MiaA [Muricauda sp. SCSIO 65647]
MEGKVLVCVVGPTAIGKTRLAIALALHFETEIISADSRQFYREMTIGTAVPSEEELHAVPHHFIQHKSIFEPYSVGDFEQDALALLKKLFQTKDVVIMVGGSGLYVDAVVKGLDDFPEIDPSVRRSLVSALKEKGIGYLQEELKQHDPEHYKNVDLQNPHRLIRALEVCLVSKKPYSSFLKKRKAKRFFKTIYTGLHADRPVIYDRIDRRVDLMLANGLVEEAKSLFEHKALNALQTVGYKELFAHFGGHGSYEEAVSEIKKNTRRFAKRQLTWYRKNENILWVNYDQTTEKIVKKLESRIKALCDD